MKLPFQNGLGNDLRAARRTRRWTQAKLAREAGISVPTFRLLESGRGNLSSWQRALDALGLALQGRCLPAAPTIGARIGALRKRRGLSRLGVAELVGSSEPTVAALERPGRGRLDVLEAVLRCLGAGAALRPNGDTIPFFNGAAISSTHHGWHTPPEILEILYGVFRQFDLDPCSPSSDRRIAPVKARVRFTIADDGLSLPWFGRVFMNPPYGRELPRWTAKARKEVAAQRARVVAAILPSRTDTRWWHTDLVGHAHIGFLQGRIRFGDGAQAAPFGSAIVVWGGTPQELQAIVAAFPTAWHISTPSPRQPGFIAQERRLNNESQHEIRLPEESFTTGHC